MQKKDIKTQLKAQISRRKFLLTAGTTTLGSLLLKSCTPPNNTETINTTAAPTTNVNAADAPETPKARLGFLAITDFAPLAIAKDKGFFAKYGMSEVEIVKQPGWAQGRDNIELGSNGGGIDGAHFPSPFPELLSEGLITKGKKIPMYTLCRLNTNGNAITVSLKYKDLALKQDSSGIKAALEKTKASGKKAQLAFAARQTNQDLWIRYWLAAGGIDPDEFFELQVIPTPQIVANMKTGTMDMFCGGEPSAMRAIVQKVGYTAVTVGEIWKNHPEKVFTMRADWVDKHPKATKALVMAIMEAQQWGDKAENKQELVQILSQQNYLGVSADLISDRINGKFDYGDGRVVDDPSLALKFWFSDGVSFSYPYQSLDSWFLLENMRWGYLPSNFDVQKVVKAVNREDIWREAAKALKVTEAEIPKSTSRGVETFFDGIKYDPENPMNYLKSLKISKL